MTKPTRPVYATDNVKRLIIRGERKRLLEVVAEALASPPDILADPDHRDGYVLVEQGREIARWREPDHPGLAAWIMTRMNQRRAALLLSRAEVMAANKQSKRGKASAKARDPEAVHAGLARLIRNALRRGEDPRAYVREWLDEYDIGRTALYALIKRIEHKPGK